MTDLKVFENEEFGKIRTIFKDGEIWFVAKDVANALNLSNSRKAIADVENKKDGVTSSYTVLDSLGRNQKMTIINEQGLYLMIMQSRKPKAVDFQLWVTGEVLPTIRKTLDALKSIEYKGNINGLVYSKDGKEFTTSKIIAEEFNRQHKDILRIIDRVNEDLAIVPGGKEFIQRNFTPVTYKDKKGELRRMYELSEEGFSYIALGFTGRKADEFKLKFIEAFFQMRETIKKLYKARLLESIFPQKTQYRQYVYIIRNPENRRIKIGVAHDVDSRIKQLQTGAGTELELLYRSVVMSNAYEVEKLMHKEFEQYRIFGEWFNINPEEVINKLEQQHIVLNSEFMEILNFKDTEVKDD